MLFYIIECYYYGYHLVVFIIAVVFMDTIKSQQFVEVCSFFFQETVSSFYS